MKTFIIKAAALLFSLGMLFSCEKNNTPSSLEGLWVATDYIYHFNESIAPKDDESERLFKEHNYFSFRFFSDGTGSIMGGNFIYTISGNTVRIHIPGDDEKHDDILLIDGKRLILEEWVTYNSEWDAEQGIWHKRRCLDFIFEKQSK